MITLHPLIDALGGQRLCLIGDGFDGDEDWTGRIQSRYPDLSVQRCSSYMSGIAELSRRPARAVIACLDRSLCHPQAAIAGLREAAGTKTRLILCCPPAEEPFARRLLESGADDYVLYPLAGRELDEAIGYARIESSNDVDRDQPENSLKELEQLSAAMQCLSSDASAFRDQLASWVRVAMQAKGASLVVEGSVSLSGDSFQQPVLSAEIRDSTRLVGRLNLGARSRGAYTLHHARKLDHCATLVGQLLSAASRHRTAMRLSVTDECSGLPNRRYLREQLPGLLERAVTEHFPITLLLFDIDDFKKYNDRFGHDAGDEILRVTGSLFRRHCREQDVVTRYGGDEFAVVFWDPAGPREAGSKPTSGASGALEVLDRFRSAMQTQEFSHIPANEEVHLTVSGGLATFPWDAGNMDDLIARADAALLAAKRAGKNRVFVIGSTGI